MNEVEKNGEQIMSPKIDQEVVSLLQDMQRKLDSMESKLDALMRDSKQRALKAKAFAGPRKEFDKTRYPKGRGYERKKEEVSSEGKFYHGRPFGKKKTVARRPAVRSKKPYRKAD